MAKPGEYIEIARGKITHHVKKDYNLYSGGDLTINAGKSVILNAEGGVSFGDHEEPPEPKARPTKSGSEKPIYQLEWINEAGEKTKGLLYGEKAIVLVTLTKSIKGKTLEFLFKEKTNGMELKKVSYSVKDDSLTQKCAVNFTIDDFVNCGRHQGQYVFELTFEEEVFANSSEILRVFPVIYIPEIMKSMGWTYSFKSQEDWFRGDPVAFPWENQPKLKDFYMGWALKFDRIKEEFERGADQWKTEKALNLLRSRIKTEMVTDHIARIPTQHGEKTEFGTSSDRIIQDWRDHEEAQPGESTRIINGRIYALEFMPAYEKYYIQNIQLRESLWTDLDDFYGSVASCNLKYFAMGTLEKKDEGIEVTILNIGAYIKDSFDFATDDFLGKWSFKDKAVQKIEYLNSAYIEIRDPSYRAYREVLSRGGDFYRYSNVYFYHPEFRFML
jgi:hypothetical protein